MANFSLLLVGDDIDFGDMENMPESINEVVVIDLEKKTYTKLREERDIANRSSIDDLEIMNDKFIFSNFVVSNVDISNFEHDAVLCSSKNIKANIIRAKDIGKEGGLSLTNAVYLGDTLNLSDVITWIRKYDKYSDILVRLLLGKLSTSSLRLYPVIDLNRLNVTENMSLFSNVGCGLDFGSILADVAELNDVCRKEVDLLLVYNKLHVSISKLRLPSCVCNKLFSLLIKKVDFIKFVKNDIVGEARLYFADIISCVKVLLDSKSYLPVFFTSKYPMHKNWGDDLNFYIFSRATSKQTLKINRFFIRPVVSGIGSIIQFIPKSLKVNLLGSGLISESVDFKSNNIQCVQFVRGPRTNERLLSSGISSSNLYGDLGLLISEFYTPNVEKKFKLGLVPHYTEKSHWFVSYCESIGVHIVDIQQDPEDFINDLYSCENIISSSLHGIIASDSYGIKNKWIILSDRVLGKGFKFDDYHEGINSKDFDYYKPLGSETLDELIIMCSEKRNCLATIDSSKAMMKSILERLG